MASGSGNSEVFVPGTRWVWAKGLFNFFGGERAPSSGGQAIGKLELADAFAVKGSEAAAEAVKHAFDLVITAFVQRNAGLPEAGDFEGGRQGVDVFGMKVKPTGQRLHCAGRNYFMGLKPVHFRHFGTSGHELF